MTYPQTRDEYRARLMQDIFKLVQHIEADQNEYSSATALAQGIHNDVREYFNESRWKPTPVYDGIQARVPVGEPVTLRLQYHEEENGVRWIQGRIVDLHHPGRPSDGAEFRIIPKGCRNPRRHLYRVGWGAALTIYRGHVEEAQASKHQPIYDHAHSPGIQYEDQETV